MADHPTLGQHLPLIKDLGTQAMSSDESEDKVRRTISYPHVYPAWCSDLLATLLWQVDDVGTQLWLCPHSGKVNTKAPAPPGLPHNCYNASWLTNLLPHQVKALRVQNKDYDFSSNGSSSPSAPSNVMQY
ncbi:hypothetical protein EDC04DRAFT_2577898 [Pisolithus marmoratus]|nr:hypothetical protein EDC04DRAFT_2577898 [Pisolithus marmoratus]